MLYKKKNAKKIAFTSFLLTILALSIFIQIPGFQNLIFDSMNNKSSEQDLLQTSETDYYTKDWITNGDFSAGSTNWTSEIDGDTSDLNLGISSGVANYEVTGEKRTFSLSEDPIIGANWLAVPNPDFPNWPSNYSTDTYPYPTGLKVYHEFDDRDANQNPSVHWDRNFTMPVDMSDYIITSASIQAVVNATVDLDVDVLGDSEATDGGADLDQTESYDYVRFYVLLSDLSKNKKYEIAYYQPSDLGYGDPWPTPGIDTLSDTYLITVPENVLIFYLTSILSSDNFNFTVTLGIRIYTADNSNTYDNDEFHELLIKSVDLTFDYEKKINQLNRASWKQDGDLIPAYYEIENATLNFKYMINASWSEYTSSPNSEFRILINNNQLGETVNLNTANGTLREIKQGGFDVTPFISPNKYVNLTIQVYIGDEFLLNSTIKISIDDVSLQISYGIITEPYDTSYNLILNNVNRTMEKSTQVTFNENLSITFAYKNSTGDFISGADVELTGGGLDPITLNPDAFDHYYTNISSTDLGVGMSYLTLTASKRYYTTIQFQISIEVITRHTEIQLFLDMNNRTIEKELMTEWNENLNITIRYRDIENAPFTHISGATVELTGVGLTKTLSEDLANEQYNISINTYDLGVGSTFLTVYASKENYTSLNIRFKITVTTRTTYLDNLNLNGTETNSIIIAWNELFNITVSYNDTATNNFIDSASLQLIGTDYSEGFSEIGESYNLTVNTFDLSIGNNFLTLLAQKDNYSIASRLITITVEERTTTIESILNHTSTSTINYPHGELINITAIYNDLSGPFIDGATVELREGATVIYTLNESSSFDQYSVEINTNELNLGVNLLTLYAKQDNFSAAFESITLIVDERDTSLEIYLENTLTTVIEREYDESINITVIYNDFADAFIDDATVELREGGTTLYTFSTHPTLNQYNLTINTKNLDLGTNLLAIYANKENYSAALVSITITVSERDTFLDVYLEEAQTTAVEIPYGEIVNITAIYRDALGPTIDGATVELRQGVTIIGTFTPSNNQYTLIQNTNILSLGSNSFSIYAKKDNHSVAIVSISIIVTERDTDLTIFLDDVERTAIVMPHGELVNITAIYNDLSGPFIEGATVELREGVTVIYTLTESLLFDQYSLEINTNELNLGVNVLTLYAKLDNYTAAFASITLTIDERDTILEIYLDDLNRTVIEKPYNEDINITIAYKDFSDAFIVGATCELREGGTTLYTFSTHPTLNQYNLTINTKNLDLGTNLLAIYANKENYSAALVSITITVSERDTLLDVYLEEVERTAIEMPHGEMVNITAIYRDVIGPPIVGATVELRQGETIIGTFTPNNNQYTLIKNTNELSLGSNFFSIYAKKDNYSVAIVSISIIVTERDTDLTIFLEEVERTAIEMPHGELVNITAIYNDLSGPFIDGATVELKQGVTIIDTFTPNNNQYTLIQNTNELSLGSNFFSIYAKKDNYSVAIVSISIIVTERDTDLTMFLEEVERTAIEIPHGELVNITAIYNDLSGPTIDGATVELRQGETIIDTFTPNNNQYTLIKNTNVLSLGSNIFSIYAKKDNYSVAIVSISIIVTERDTDLTIFLDDVERTAIEVTYGELINITVIYEDFTESFIDSANVELREGSTVLDTLSPDIYQYVLMTDSKEFNLGSNVLSIYAKKENYSVSLVSILITVNERDTTLDVLLNAVDSSTFEFFNISINEVLNITAIYDDVPPIFITGATVELTGLGISETLTLHPTFNQYNYTLNPEVLGVGVHFLVISADIENYTSSIKNIKLNVLERDSNLELHIDGDDLTSSRYIAAEIDQTLNVTVYFTDSSDDSFISNANLKLSGALNDNLTANAILEHYNISIRTNDLEQGINFLTIFAQKQEYVSQSIVFTIEVIEKASDLQLFLNGNNETLGKSIEVTVGESINVTVVYEDYTNLFIDSAEVIIVGEGIDSNLTKHLVYDHYNVTIDSDDLNFGINLLTLYANRINYQPQTLIIRIEIIEKETDLHIFLNGFNKTIDRTLTLPIRSSLNVTVKYLDYDTGLGLSGATIQLVGEGLSENMTDNTHQQYSVIINTNQIDIGVRFLTIYAQRANYQSYSALLRIQVDRIQTNITTVSGETVINRQPGQNYELEINLLDLDFSTDILNATVTYTWAYGQGTLTDPENDGIYEGPISNLVEGTFVITISVYAGDDYEFERFTVTLNVVRPAEDVLLFQILTILGVSAALGLGGYLFAYQRVLKYPKQVRKIRKYKSQLKKQKPMGIEIRSRDQLIEDNYAEKIHPLEKQLKSKIAPKTGKNEIQKDTLEQSENNQNT